MATPERDLRARCPRRASLRRCPWWPTALPRDDEHWRRSRSINLRLIGDQPHLAKRSVGRDRFENGHALHLGSGAPGASLRPLAGQRAGQRGILQAGMASARNTVAPNSIVSGNGERPRHPSRGVHDSEPSPKSASASARRRAVNYHDIGQGDPVMLIHGSGPGISSWVNWGKVADPVAEVRLIMPDMIGWLPRPRVRFNLDIRWAR